MDKNKNLKDKIHEVIFEADTPAGRNVDLIILFLIIISVVVVMLESIEAIDLFYHDFFFVVEWVLTALFIIEYGLRVYCVENKSKYMLSFFGVIDLIAILPNFIELLFAGTHYIITIRILRLLRVFRIFKAARFIYAGSDLWTGIKQSRVKITVFIGTVLLITICIGSLMYIIEGNSGSGFESIPQSMYWAIVTLTTVGYGDITPVTPLGKLLSAAIMILGYGIIAVPTSIVTAEMVKDDHKKSLEQPVHHNTQHCRHCGFSNHADDAVYCKKCGEHLLD